jgi:diguanylate cyclase (GGDEF)-like protein
MAPAALSIPRAASRTAGGTGGSDVTGSAGRMNAWLDHAPALRRDPVLIGMALWTLLAVVLFGALAGRTDDQVRVFWILQVPLDVVLMLCSWRIQRIATGAVRRFWRVMTGVGALFLVGDNCQTALTLAHPGAASTAGGPAQTACLAIGLAAMVLAMLLHPHSGRSGRERLAFWLDSATVLVGGGVIAWCFAVTAEQSSNPDIVGTLAAAGVSVTAAFAAVKMILSGNAPMHRTAAAFMIGSAAAMSVGVFLAPAAATSLPVIVYLVRFLPSVLIAGGPRVQDVIARFDPAPFGERRRKAYSLLPYGSIVVVFGAMVVVLPGGVNARLWGVVAGLGLICGLVAGRQLVAFHDNTTLIRRLDATLADLRAHQARLRHQAMVDGLTGLANRTHFHEQVAAALAVPSPPGTVSLLLIDLDGFKAVNDTMGHAAGDALLAGVADKLREVVRAGDLAARLGGDEFAVLLRDRAAHEVEQTAQRILDVLRIPVPIGGFPVAVGASIGVAAAGPGDDVESLLHAADTAMYAAKKDGKGVWLRYDIAMETGRREDAGAQAVAG